MAQTKHKFFKLKLSEDGSLTFTKSIENTINDFLMDPNNVYVNHSITTLNEDIDEYGEIKTINKFVLISLVYKDLSESKLDLKMTSNKTKDMVHENVVESEHIPSPNYITQLDKDIEEIIVQVKEKEVRKSIKIMRNI